MSVNGVKRKPLRIEFNSNTSHVYQVLTGYSTMFGSGLDFVPNENLPGSCVKAVYPEWNILFDLEDGWLKYYPEIDDALLKESRECIAIFKRSYLRENIVQNKLGVPIFPMAPNYECYDSTTEKIAFPSFRKYVKYLLRGSLGYDLLEKPVSDYLYDVCYLTRLWDPNAQECGGHQMAVEERVRINSMRIDLCRAIRNEFGSKAKVGIYASDYAKSQAAELCLNRFDSYKPHYLKMMKSSRICVSSIGLHGSNGWKMGEYFASGKAIVAENPIYEIPFTQEGINYLSFSTIEECINEINDLLSNPSRIELMENANKRYYEEHLRPDAIVNDAIEIIERMMNANNSS